MALQIFESARAVLEASRGAGGTPTRILSFTELTHTQDVQTIRPASYRANYEAYYDAATGTETNSVSMSGDMTYAMAAWLGYVYVSGAPTTTTFATASGTAYQYAFTPVGNADNLKTTKLELGYSDTASSTAIVSLPYVGGNELSLTWNKSDSTIQYNASLLSASTASKLTAFTGSPTSPTTTLLSTSTTQVYWDTSTIGATVDNYVTQVEWSLQNNWSALYTLNNSNSAQSVFRAQPRTWTMTISRYFNDALRWAPYETKATQKLRVRTTGSTLGTATYTMDLDVWGVITGREVTDGGDGLAIESITLEPIFSTDASTSFRWNVINNESSIT